MSFAWIFQVFFVESIFNHFVQAEWVVVGGKMDSPKFHDIFQTDPFPSLTNGDISSSNNSDSIKNKSFVYWIPLVVHGNPGTVNTQVVNDWFTWRHDGFSPSLKAENLRWSIRSNFGCSQPYPTLGSWENRLRMCPAKKGEMFVSQERNST